MVERAYPDRRAIETVVAWLSELAKLDEMHAWASEVSRAQTAASERRVLDVKLDDASLSIARRMIEGDGEVEQATRDALRGSILLRPLFT
jgi:hypothetical protein